MNKIETIQKIVCDTFKVSLPELLGTNREPSITDARHTSIALAAQFGCDHIAEAHDRDRTSISHSIKRCADLKDVDRVFKAKFQKAEQAVKALFEVVV